MDRMVLAYSGGRRSTAAIAHLVERGAEVVAVAVDFGQNAQLEAARDRALALGAVRAHVMDARDEFARDYLVRSIRAGALPDDRSATPRLAWPLLAKKLAEIASIERADAIAHVCTPRGRDGARFETALRACLGTTYRIVRPRVAPRSSIDAAGPATSTASTTSAASTSFAAPIATSTSFAPPTTSAGSTRSMAPTASTRSAASLSRSHSAATQGGQAASVEIAFDRGNPVALNGIAMPILELLASLHIMAGAQRVGGSQGVGSPAPFILDAAHEELQRTSTSADTHRFSGFVSRQYAAIIERGMWFAPLRRALDAYIDNVQELVTGVVGVALFNGACEIVRDSPRVDASDDRLPTLDAPLPNDDYGLPIVGHS